MPSTQIELRHRYKSLYWIVDFGYGNTFLMPGLGGVGQGVGNAIADPLIAGLPPVGLPALSSAV